MRYWWVNQGGTYKIEHKNGYMWSPKREKDNVRSQAYENMKLVAPGDLILSHYNKNLRSIGTAQSYAFSCSRPADFPDEQNTGNIDGWMVRVNYKHDVKPVSPKENFDLLKPLLPSKYSPLDIHGVAVMKLYLIEIEHDLAETLLNLMELTQNDFPGISTIDSLGLLDSKKNQDKLQREIESRQDISATEKEYLCSARIGQGVFRERVSKIEKKCRVSSVSNKDFLIASHIKAWSESNDLERLDGDNGLLLTPNIDRLFDRYFISFSDEGYLLVSPLLSEEIRQKFGLIEGMSVGSFSEGQKRYLSFHRSRFKDGSF